MKAVGYFRETIASGRTDNIGRQNRRFLDYCEAQGFEVATTFAEENKDGNAAFAQLIEYLRRPEKGFISVVLPEPATLSEEAAVATARCIQIEGLGASVQFMTANGATDDAVTAVLRAWTSSNDDASREKMRDALRRKAVRGEVLGRPPYGYHAGSRNRLELVDDEAVVVRYIFRLYLQEGLGIRLIARRLNEEGLRTRRNRPWSMVSIRDLLRNRAYLGTYQRLGVRVPGTHPALVSPDDFRRVQERLQDRRTNFSPRTVGVFLLSGLVSCATCGNRMIGVSRRQAWKRRGDGSEQAASYRYYQCESRTNQGICTYNTQRAEELEERVRQQLAAIDSRQLATAGDNDAVISQWQAEIRRLRTRLQQIDRRLSRLLDEASAANLTSDKLRVKASPLAEERLKVEEELRDAEWRAEHYATAAERRRTRTAVLEVLVDQWPDLPLARHQQLLREIIDQIKVSDTELKLVLRP